MKEIKEYNNITFGQSTIPKPKNWSRKTFDCSCNIPVVGPESKFNGYFVGGDIDRVDTKFIVKHISKEISVPSSGSNKKRWWFEHKPCNWEVTHLQIPDFKDVKYNIQMGHIERGGALTPTPLYIIVEEVEKYKTLMLVRKRKSKLKKLLNK